ncbi:MAG: S-layer homology domain-containing protein [Deltaproteobacteria bacterium]
MLVPVAGLLLVAAGCARPAPKCAAPEDNPQHHYLRGMELLEKNRIEDASVKFDRALYCEDGYSPAHSGLAIADAMKAGNEKNEGYRKVDHDRAFAHLKSARKSAETPEDEFAYRTASMRVYTVLKPAKWLSDVEGDYSKAMKLKTDDRKLIYYDGKEAATYFMGGAYLDGREFQKARDSFSAVLSAKREGRWNEPADKGWKKTDKIVRAIGGITVGDVGKEIAVKDSVTRGDMAALLVDEVKIEKLFAGRIPVKSAVDRMKPEFTPADVLNSQFKDETLTMMKWGVRGLEPVYDNATKAYLFRPDAPISRKEFALVIEDVLIKLTGDESMASAFLGHGKSPFPDVQPASAWYNAIMNVTTKNLMETELSGEFRPDDTVDGAEAMLAIRVLRQRLNIY